jgi:hypothetical protein
MARPCLLPGSKLIASQDFADKKRIIAQGMSYRKTIRFLVADVPMM